MRGCLTTIVGLFVLAAIIGAIAGGNSSGGSSSPSTASSSAVSSEATEPHPASSKPEEAPSESRSLPVGSSGMNACARLIRAGSHTSCQFAENVNSAFQALKESAGAPPATVTAYSPVTHMHYKLRCVLIDQRITVECVTDTASVAFPLETSETTTPSESSSSRPGEEPSSGSSSEEDEVGSPSHAGDQKFCEEHECIGNFTGEEGTVVECSDGTYSHAGGLSGACSDHGGEADK